MCRYSANYVQFAVGIGAGNPIVSVEHPEGRYGTPQLPAIQD